MPLDNISMFGKVLGTHNLVGFKTNFHV